jgi:hypothetical protein
MSGLWGGTNEMLTGGVVSDTYMAGEGDTEDRDGTAASQPACLFRFWTCGFL